MLQQSENESVNDRRRSYRLRAEGVAMLWQGERFLGQYQLEDISLGGCLVRGPALRRRSVESDLAVRLALHHAQPMFVRASTVRTQGRGAHFKLALRFAHHGPAMEDALHDQLLAALEEGPGSTPVGLLVGLGRARRQVLSRSLTRLGWRSVGANSMLGVVQALLAHEQQLGAVFVDGTEPREAELGLLEFLADTYPQVKTVAVVDAQHDASTALDAMCWSTDCVIPSVPSFDVMRTLTRTLSATT